MTSTLDSILASQGRPNALTTCLTPWATRLRQNVIVMHSTASQWLIDLERSAFQRIERSADPERHLLSGAWVPYDELGFFPAAKLLVVEPKSGPTLRAHIQPRAPRRSPTREGIPPPPPIER